MNVCWSLCAKVDRSPNNNKTVMATYISVIDIKKQTTKWVGGVLFLSVHNLLMYPTNKTINITPEVLFM